MDELRFLPDDFLATTGWISSSQLSPGHGNRDHDEDNPCRWSLHSSTNLQSLQTERAQSQIQPRRFFSNFFSLFQLDSRAPETQLISAEDWVRDSAVINPAYLPLIPKATPLSNANVDRTLSVKSRLILLSACLKAQRIIYTRFRTKFI